MDGHWKFQGGEGKYEAKLEFPKMWGGGVQIKYHQWAMGGGVVFSATKQCKHALSVPNSPKASAISYNYMYTAIQTT